MLLYRRIAIFKLILVLQKLVAITGQIAMDSFIYDPTLWDSSLKVDCRCRSP